MIISKLIGGLGNQMFQYAAAYALASYHKTGLKLDNLFLLDTRKRYYRFEYRPYALDIFNITGTLATNKEISRFTVPRKGNRYIYHLKKRLLPTRSVFTDSVIPDYQSLIQLPSEAYLEGYFQRYEYFSPVGDGLKKEFTFKDKLPEECIAILKKIQNSNSVCVCFRRGDYVGHPVLDIITLDFYYEALNILKERIPNLSVYVFSDDIPWCMENFKSSDFKIEFVDQKYTGEKAKDYLQLMANCNHFILPNSTFPYWAAFLGDFPGKVVIAPKKWYNGQEVEVNPILPSEWIVI